MLISSSIVGVRPQLSSGSPRDLPETFRRPSGDLGRPRPQWTLPSDCSYVLTSFHYAFLSGHTRTGTRQLHHRPGIEPPADFQGFPNNSGVYEHLDRQRHIHHRLGLGSRRWRIGFPCDVVAHFAKLVPGRRRRRRRIFVVPLDSCMSDEGRAMNPKRLRAQFQLLEARAAAHNKLASRISICAHAVWEHLCNDFSLQECYCPRRCA